MLEALDPEHHESIDEFEELLKNVDAYMEKIAREKGHQKKNLPN